MRPVNLLPAKNRPHQPTGTRSGSSYAVLGALALALLAITAYVLESNKVTQAKSDIATAEQATAEARAKTQQLSPFGNFAQIADQRVASVKQLAGGRFDWERSIRELAHVLPDGVWLSDFDASVAGTGGTTDAAAWTGPSMKLHGCAEKQPQVATMLVRLRALEGVHDVRLTDSTRGQDVDSEAVGDSAGGATDGCGENSKRANYEFNAVVEFEQAEPVATGTDKKQDEVPVRLGGGS